MVLGLPSVSKVLKAKKHKTLHCELQHSQEIQRKPADSLIMIYISPKIFIRQRLMDFSFKLNSSASQHKTGNNIPRVHNEHFRYYLSIMTNRFYFMYTTTLKWP